MREGRDFGIIPGCQKPSLWKPGAEKLLNFHGLGCRLEAGSGTVVNWDSPFFNYEYKAVAFKRATGSIVAESFGSCNSKEAKYRYLWLTENKLPRGLDKESLEWQERPARNGGKFKVYRVENNELYNLVNTIQKMAQKRALIGTALIACRASDSFTADLEEPEGETGQDKPEAPAAAGTEDRKITEVERKSLFAKAITNGVPEANLKTYLTNKFDYIIVGKDKLDTSLLQHKDFVTAMEWICKKPQ